MKEIVFQLRYLKKDLATLNEAQLLLCIFLLYILFIPPKNVFAFILLKQGTNNSDYKLLID